MGELAIIYKYIYTYIYFHLIYHYLDDKRQINIK